MALTRQALVKAGIRIGVSALLVFIVLTLTEHSGFRRVNMWPGVWPLVAAASFWFAGILCMAPRIQLLARPQNIVIPSAVALRLTLEGHALGQISPGLVGGDVWRSIQLARLGLTSAAAVRVVATDRIIGLVGLAVLAGIAWAPSIVIYLHPSLTLVLAVGLLALAAFGARAWCRWTGFRPLGCLTRFALPAPDLLLLVALAVAGHLVNGAAFLVIGLGLGLHVPLMTGLAILSVAFFLAALPIAFGGWGAREAAVAAGFIAIGQATSVPVATSILYGLLLLACSVPGLVLLLVEPLGRRAPGA